MATIKNRKREPLSEEDVKKKFPHGIGIYQCDDGICLIFGRREGYHDAKVMLDHGAQNDEQWWADLRSHLQGQFLPFTQKGSEREKLENIVNTKLFDLPRLYTLFAEG